MQDRLQSELKDAISASDTERVLRLLDQGANPVALGEEDWSPLHFAAREGNGEVVQVLLDHCDPSMINVTERRYGCTPLHFAAMYGRKDVCLGLLGAKADPLIRDVSDVTALRYAVRSNHVEVVKALVAAGADIHDLDKSGNTLLHEAAMHGSEQALEYLLSLGISIDEVSQIGKTPLHMAASRGHTQMLDTLLDAGAKIDAQCDIGGTALIQAALYNHPDSVELLLSRGADSAIQEKEGRTALHIAIWGGYSSIVKRLLKEPTASKALNNAKWPALQLCLYGGSHPELLEMLLDSGVPVDQQDENGKTPLHVAAAMCDLKAVGLLLRQPGIKLGTKDNEGMTAIMAARAKKEARPAGMNAVAFREIEKRLADAEASIVAKKHTETITSVRRLARSRPRL